MKRFRLLAIRVRWPRDVPSGGEIHGMSAGYDALDSWLQSSQVSVPPIVLLSGHHRVGHVGSDTWSASVNPLVTRTRLGQGPAFEVAVSCHNSKNLADDRSEERRVGKEC